MSSLLEQFIRCPSCGSTEIRIFDKGYKRLWRLFSFNPRFLCSSCKTSWRLKKPQHLVKVKRKARWNRGSVENAFRLRPVPEGFWGFEDEQLEELVQGWRSEGWRRFCLDLGSGHSPTDEDLHALTHLYRILKEGRNELLVINGDEAFNDALWRLGLGYLIHVNQEVAE